MKRIDSKPRPKAARNGAGKVPPKLPQYSIGDPYSRFVTKAEAAAYLRTTVRTIDRLIKAGRLRSKKLLRSRLIPRSSLLAFVAEPPTA